MWTDWLLWFLVAVGVGGLLFACFVLYAILTLKWHT